MRMLHVEDEQEINAYIDFLDPSCPTTVWHAEADGYWELCVMATVDGVSYFDSIDDVATAGSHVKVFIKRRKLRFGRRWKIIESNLFGKRILLRPVIRY